ncbi:hypothetical protein K8Z49_08575 [Actinomadura madurae]|uniref:hypothetical protein n=1 Tax=Actinomadura madurae TaxID=1993 RepID=UPI00399A7B3B
MAEVVAATERFGHRAHLLLTWLAVCRAGMPAAIGLVSDGIQRTARYAGVPQKCNATVSRAWVEFTGIPHCSTSADSPASTAQRHWPARKLAPAGSNPTWLPSPWQGIDQEQSETGDRTST